MSQKGAGVANSLSGQKWESCLSLNASLPWLSGFWSL